MLQMLRRKEKSLRPNHRIANHWFANAENAILEVTILPHRHTIHQFFVSPVPVRRTAVRSIDRPDGIHSFHKLQFCFSILEGDQQIND